MNDAQQSLPTRKRVFLAVSCIPRGNVATYTWVARKAQTHPRAVGAILHTNIDPLAFPCHRVLDSRGRLSRGYAFGGIQGHKKRLMEEGVLVDDTFSVDLKQYALKDD